MYIFLKTHKIQYYSTLGCDFFKKDEHKELKEHKERIHNLFNYSKVATGSFPDY